MTLLFDFKTAAVARTRFPDNERLTAAAIFALVRDMPFEVSSDMQPETVIAEWRATAPGKHLLLQTLYEEFGHGAMLIGAMHEWSQTMQPWLPESLLGHLKDGPIPDVHMFIRLHINDDWTTVDATWPLGAARLGMPVNERFEPGHEMTIACDPDEILHVPPNADPTDFYQWLVDRHIGDQSERRERFIADLSAWLARELSPTQQAAR